MDSPTDAQFTQLIKNVTKLVQNDEKIKNLRETKEGALDRELSSRNLPSTPSFSSVMVQGRETQYAEFNIDKFLALPTRPNSFIRLSQQIDRLWTRTGRLRQCIDPITGTFSRELFQGLRPRKDQNFSDFNDLTTQTAHYLDISNSLIYIMNGDLVVE